MQSQKKTIYFVRHGQTAGNVAGYTLGPDIELNELGRQQSQDLAQRAQGMDFTRIISSEDVRAKQTAQVVQEVTGKPLELSKLFCECRRPSEFWNRSLQNDSEVRAGYKEIYDNFGAKGWRHSDEENFDDIKQRGQDALRYLRDQKDAKVIVVTHSKFLRNLFGLILNEDSYSPLDYIKAERTFSLEHVSITTASWMFCPRQERFSWRINNLNDCAHLTAIV